MHTRLWIFLLEYKSVQNIPILGEDQPGNNTWLDKFRNCLNNARPGSREALKHLEDEHREQDDPKIDSMKFELKSFFIAFD